MHLPGLSASVHLHAWLSECSEYLHSWLCVSVYKCVCVFVQEVTLADPNVRWDTARWCLAVCCLRGDRADDVVYKVYWSDMLGSESPQPHLTVFLPPPLPSIPRHVPALTPCCIANMCTHYLLLFTYNPAPPWMFPNSPALKLASKELTSCHFSHTLV